MIARLWKGHVPAARAQEYLRLMREVALPDYKSVAGNRGAWCLHRAAHDLVEVQMLTFWDSFEAIAMFAGDPLAKAKYYDFDPDYLVEMAETVLHYEVDGDAPAAA